MVSLILAVVTTTLFLNCIYGADNSNVVTCGSVVKLIHKETGNHLHSHSIAWGSGSGQQSVTATGSSNDPNSLWLIKESTTSNKACEVATPVQCGSVIRLEHSASGKNLHSHLFRAPLSGNQEVSGFGEGGVGDTGDNWIIECNPGEKYWDRGAVVSFKHADTGKYLFTGDHVKFNQQNCGGGCPIMVMRLQRNLGTTC